MLQYLEWAATTGEGADRFFGNPAPVDLRWLRSDIAFQKFRATWMDANVTERVRALSLVNSLAQFRWLAPRLFGIRGLVLARRLWYLLLGRPGA